MRPILITLLFASPAFAGWVDVTSRYIQLENCPCALTGVCECLPGTCDCPDCPNLRDGGDSTPPVSPPPPSQFTSAPGRYGWQCGPGGCSRVWIPNAVPAPSASEAGAARGGLIRGWRFPLLRAARSFCLRCR